MQVEEKEHRPAETQIKMQSADLDVVKEIPGYKVILKTVLKSQIQLLVQQLADQIGEESVILTASVEDGTLSHLGSESGKDFLEGHEDIKSQFLGFCLKKHHRQAQTKRDTPDERFSGSGMLLRNEKPYRTLSSGRMPHGHSSSEQYLAHQDVTQPVSLSRAHSRGSGIRHKPYSKSLYPNKRSALQASETADDEDLGNNSRTRRAALDKLEGSYCVGEQNADDLSDDEADEHEMIRQTDLETQGDSATDIGKTSSEDDDNTNYKTMSNVEANEMDPNVTVKDEAIPESEMELAITGDEPGHFIQENDSWNSNITPMGDESSPLPMAAQGSSTDQQSYIEYSMQVKSQHSNDPVTLVRKCEVCNICGKSFRTRWHLERHMLIHTGEKPFSCEVCGRRFNLKHNWKTHMLVHLENTL